MTLGPVGAAALQSALGGYEPVFRILTAGLIAAGGAMLATKAPAAPLTQRVPA